ncbi:MAG: restriction endonuclease subunit S [Planctomycetaceae bacterium]|nr:restriction endonuclease subunit S [Planctomycetaceae bacterium]
MEITGLQWGHSAAVDDAAAAPQVLAQLDRHRFPRLEVVWADTRPSERERLVKFGKALGKAIEELISIVSPSTFYRWCREAQFGKKPKHPKGGQRKPREIRELVIQIAKTTGFGYSRIIGELRKLGIKKISRQTVRNILKEADIQPGPDRTSDCWENFLQRHGETLWAVDFFSVKSVTVRGLRDLYLMAFLCLKTREVIVTSSTEHPNSAWVKQQTERFIEQTGNRTEKPSIVIHDRDTKFTKEFVATLKAKGIRTNALPVASPNLNGRVERFIQTIKYECLLKFILFGRRHVDHIVAEWVTYYNQVRSHMERGHLPPIREAPEEEAVSNGPRVPLRDIARPVLREVIVQAGISYRTIGVKWWGEGAYERQTIDGSQTAASKLWLVKKDDLIINKIWVRHGSTAVASDAVDGCAASNEFPTFELNPKKVLPRWLHWLSKTRTFWHQCDALSMGTSGKNRIKPEKFLAIEVPLPPLSEQQKIVEWIDAVATRVEEARRLRAELATESEVLSSVFSFVMETSTTHLNTSTLLEYVERHDSGWSPQCGDSPAKGDEWAVLKTTCVQWDGFHPEENKSLLVGMTARPNLAVDQGDVLITRAGPVNRVGVACVVNEPRPRLMLSDKLVRLKTTSKIDPDYLALFLRTPSAQEYFRQGKTGLAESQVNISREKLRRLPIKVPPLDEQRRLTAHVQHLQETLVQAKRVHRKIDSELSALLPSVLNQAFGESA